MRTFERLQASPDFKSIFTPLEKMAKVDDYTVELVSKAAYPLVLQTATYIFPMTASFTQAKQPKVMTKLS